MFYAEPTAMQTTGATCRKKTECLRRDKNPRDAILTVLVTRALAPTDHGWPCVAAGWMGGITALANRLL